MNPATLCPCPASKALILANTMDTLPAFILLFRKGLVGSANAFWLSVFSPLLYPDLFFNDFCTQRLVVLVVPPLS